MLLFDDVLDRLRHTLAWHFFRMDEMYWITVVIVQ